MAKETKQAIGIEIFPLAQFVENEGNPRKKAEDTMQMVDSLLIFPKMLSVRPLAYTKTEDTLLVLGGNYRLRGLNEIAGYTLDIIKERLSGMIGWEKKSSKEQAALLAFWKKWLAEPVAYGICLDGMTVEEKKEFIIKDNLSYGQWDEEALRGWNREAVEEWGLSLPTFLSDEDIDGLFEEGKAGKKKDLKITLIFSADKEDSLEEIISQIKPIIEPYNGKIA